MLDLTVAIKAEADHYVRETQGMTDAQLEAYHKFVAEAADFLYLGGKTDSDEFGAVLINASDPTSRQTMLMACFWAGTPAEFNRLLDAYGSKEAKSARDYLAAKIVNSAN